MNESTVNNSLIVSKIVALDVLSLDFSEKGVLEKKIKILQIYTATKVFMRFTNLSTLK